MFEYRCSSADARISCCHNQSQQQESSRNINPVATSQNDVVITNLNDVVTCHQLVLVHLKEPAAGHTSILTADFATLYETLTRGAFSFPLPFARLLPAEINTNASTEFQNSTSRELQQPAADFIKSLRLVTSTGSHTS
ncbi:hypothetical protein F511_43119 [Dorcoceras hygrometricum]|uniref:Uncharacterized protein n=1 Tax=Dorcoceras hygrometricum TaxID=472368 RepID=A0A2Z7C1F7_9LAMI|nr:hypothetical protein F511_43119 [Dorcoceras hygrometricum]